MLTSDSLNINQSKLRNIHYDLSSMNTGKRTVNQHFLVKFEQTELLSLTMVRAPPSENVPPGRADSEGPDQTAHPRSLIRAFTIR